MSRNKRKGKFADVKEACRHCGSANVMYRVTHFFCRDCGKATNLHPT